MTERRRRRSENLLHDQPIVKAINKERAEADGTERFYFGHRILESPKAALRTVYRDDEEVDPSEDALD